MHYDDAVYRPPREARTPLLQVTSGCSHNKCTYCSMYKDVEFKVSPMKDIEEDIIEISNTYRNCTRIYLINGDPFVLSYDKLLEIFNLIHKHIPNIETISMYASIKNISKKSLEEIKKLRSLGLNKLYIGLESGWDKVLKEVNKGNTSEEAYRELKKLEEANVEYNPIIMLGLAGKGNCIENAKETAKLFNRLNARGVFCTSTTVLPGTTLWDKRESGEFVEASEYERILETKTLLEELKPNRPTIFNSSHISNTMYMHGFIPEKKEEFIRMCDEILNNYTEEEFQKEFQRNELIRI